MRRLSLAFFTVLTAAALGGMGLAWGINLMLFGRPHGALLQLLAEMAAEAINCSDPRASPLFLPHSSGTRHLKNLQLVLLDTAGQVLAQRTVGLDAPPSLENIERDSSHWRTDNPLRATSLWVHQDQICQQNWTLWVQDPENTIYRELMLPRQLILVLSSSGCMILVVLFAYLFLQSKGRNARNVLQHIREGSWGSRIEQALWEPRLQLIDEFNSMAKAVEDSIQRLEQSESRRARLLRELAHDVRTPLASLRAAAETLKEFHDTITVEQREKLQETLMLDLEYFQRLIDDLLILAQVDRTDTAALGQWTDLRKVIPAAWQSSQEHSSVAHLAICLQWSADCSDPAWVPGDEALLRRLLQNAFDNAFHFAQKEVFCTIHWLQNRWRIEVRNDCKALSPEDLSHWGHKRRQRIITEKAGQAHTSLGLGSSIIVGVSRHLGGNAWLEQNITEHRDTAYVSVWIELPGRPGAPNILA